MDSIYKILESLDQVSEDKDEVAKIQAQIDELEDDIGELDFGSASYDSADAKLQDLHNQLDRAKKKQVSEDKDKIIADAEVMDEDEFIEKYTGEGMSKSEAEAHWKNVNESVEEAEITPIDHSGDEDGASVEDIESAITRRMMGHPKFGELVREIDIIDLNDAIEDVARFHAGGDLGTSDVSSMVNDVLKQLKKEGALNEEDIEENAFNQAAADAARAGKKEFEFDGKTYPVKMDKDTAHKLDDNINEDYDKDEYDEEGEMAKNQLDVACDATKELKAMIEDDENLPEWVQKKITLAMDYLDTARDYMKSVEDDMETTDEVEFELEEAQLDEKSVSKAQQKAAGAALAAKRGDIPKSELTGASKEMLDMSEKDLEDFAGTKHKGLPEKKKKKTDETTVAGAVAVSADATGSSVYGNPSVYESMNNTVENLITESMSVNVSDSTEGEPTVTVSATGEDAQMLSQLLQLAAVKKTPCPGCGRVHEGECMREEDEANSAANTETYDMEYLLNAISGGLNAPKRQINPNNPGDNPMAMNGDKTVNIEESEDTSVSHLETLYKEFKNQ